MNIHHLNCGTMYPFGGRLLGGPGGERARMVCHCLLIETAAGLVLVDAGFGTDDLRSPEKRIGRTFIRIVRPKFDPGETAIRQVEQLGYSAGDVRHIVTTHLDLDHAGGLGDFPDARVHCHAEEHKAAIERPTRAERERYRPAHWAHGPQFITYSDGGESWFGFEGVCQLESLPPEILLVPLFGHSRGHCAVALDTGSGWLLHCGDAYFFRGEMASDCHVPFGLKLFQRFAQVDGKLRKSNQNRLRELVSGHGTEVRAFSSHDPVEFDELAQTPWTADADQRALK